MLYKVFLLLKIYKHVMVLCFFVLFQTKICNVAKAFQEEEAGRFPWWGETKLPILVTMACSVHNICVTMPYDHHHAITPIVGHPTHH